MLIRTQWLILDPGGYVQLEAKSGTRAPATRGYLNGLANAIYESDDCAEDAFVVFEMESETEAWGIGKVIERFILVTEDGDIEHLNMAAPGETLMEGQKHPEKHPNPPLRRKNSTP
jgi:hypothetical protein